MGEHNIVVLRGTLSGEPRSKELASGIQLLQYDVTTRDDTGTASVPVVWFDPPAAAIDRHREGDDVLVVGTVRRRFFRAAGATQSRTEVVAERVTAARRSRDVERVLGPVRVALETIGVGP